MTVVANSTFLRRTVGRATDAVHKPIECQADRLQRLTHFGDFHGLRQFIVGHRFQTLLDFAEHLPGRVRALRGLTDDVMRCASHLAQFLESRFP